MYIILILSNTRWKSLPDISTLLHSVFGLVSNLSMSLWAANVHAVCHAMRTSPSAQASGMHAWFYTRARSTQRLSADGGTLIFILKNMKWTEPEGWLYSKLLIAQLHWQRQQKEGGCRRHAASLSEHSVSQEGNRKVVQPLLWSCSWPRPWANAFD